MNINRLIVKYLSISNKEALRLLRESKVLINGKVAPLNQLVQDTDHIIVENKVVQVPAVFKYVVLNKPKGIECTLNPKIDNSLLSILPFDDRLFPVGRLDKDSEGLLLLTNDGRLYKKIAGDETFKEKEYFVKVDKVLTEEALSYLEQGIVIMGKLTRPAIVKKVDDYSFQIILTQGLNRQIRRMCYKLGYEVQMLKRIRIMSIFLNDLPSGEHKVITRESIFKDYTVL